MHAVETHGKFQTASILQGQLCDTDPRMCDSEVVDEAYGLRRSSQLQFDLRYQSVQASPDRAVLIVIRVDEGAKNG